MAQSLTPPDEDEFEVSIFGPGYGEALLLHLGDNRWMAVDCCVDDEGQAVPMSYLNAIGMPPGEVLSLIVATHWHDDHVRGLGALLESSRQDSRFVCATALQTDEFFVLVAASEHDPTIRTSGASEFAHFLRVFRERGTTPVYAGANRLLEELETSAGDTRVITISPSDAAFEAAVATMAGLSPEAPTTKRRIPAPTRNHATVGLWASLGVATVLLGGDLENGNLGWTSVLALDPMPPGRADIYKVAHHGSANSHEPRVWDELLTPRPLAILAPWSLGNTSLPTDAMIRSICDLSDEAYATSKPGIPGQLPRAIRARKLLEKSGVRLRRRNAQAGQIRIRWRNDNEPNVALIGGAMRLSA